MNLDRLFTSGLPERYESSTSFSADFVVPDSWSFEAAEALLAACKTSIPAKTQAIEENTVPSFLWQRKALGTALTREKSAFQVFERVVGAAAYQAWKKELFANEAELRNFYDEARAMLLGRFVVPSSDILAKAGFDWAYGIKNNTPAIQQESSPFVDLEKTDQAHKNKIELRNASLDAILDVPSSKAALQWGSLFGQTSGQALAFRFADTAREWDVGANGNAAPRLLIDLLAFRREDGGLAMGLLRHAVKLSVLMADLLFDEIAPQARAERPLAIGFANLAAFLMAEALPYDSAQGRATAASIAALISGEATLFSAELAARLGACPAFAANRDVTLRTLRNRRRATYGERNDYEHLSVLPAALDVSASSDLVLLATAERVWDQAEEAAHAHGLRHLRLTALSEDSFFTAFLESSSTGTSPEPSLTRDFSEGEDVFRKGCLPAVRMGIEKIGCDPSDSKAILDHIAGYNSLIAAPAINHLTLKERGFTDEVLQKLEAYLSQVRDIRFAFTPWILGASFCHEVLKISEDKLFDPAFDLLEALGFSKDAVQKANGFCCGYGVPQGAFEFPREAAPIFATKEALSPEAEIRMAAAVQPYIAEAVPLTLELGMAPRAEILSPLALLAWREGLREIAFFCTNYDAPAEKRPQVMMAAPKSKRLLRRKVSLPVPPKTALAAKVTAMMRTPQTAKPKASFRAMSLKRTASKITHTGDGKRK